MMRYFEESEFRMGGMVVFDMMDTTFLNKLDELRGLCGFPFVLNSTYRSPEYNFRIGGAPNSKHMEGIAADIQCIGSTPRSKLVKHALNLGLTVGVYKNFVHVDDREHQIMFVP
jgi:uncharacterized protein YcbK (DUF882 family)